VYSAGVDDDDDGDGDRDRLPHVAAALPLDGTIDLPDSPLPAPRRRSCRRRQIFSTGTEAWLHMLSSLTTHCLADRSRVHLALG
jgi:hypothetical protein